MVLAIQKINSHIELSVADNGRGISADFLPHIFERFRQADSSTTRQYGGLGIGLSLVKQLIELHGGNVRAESPGLGLGATLTVSLPVVIARPPSTSMPSHAPSEQTVEDNQLAGIKVLAVDDDVDSLGMVRRILESHGAKVATASSMEDGLKHFAEFMPHVVLSDIGMPTHDGYDFIRRVRLLPGGRGVPSAALTALARTEDRMRALQAGFQSHVVKPIAPSELIAVVRSLSAMNPASPQSTTAHPH